MLLSYILTKVTMWNNGYVFCLIVGIIYICLYVFIHVQFKNGKQSWEEASETVVKEQGYWRIAEDKGYNVVKSQRIFCLEIVNIARCYEVL
jgi:hypothetical protein